MSNQEFAVRTLYLAHFFEAAAKLADQRRSPTNPQELINAMKRVELADKTLEKELNAFAEKGYNLAAIIQHTLDPKYKDDLLVTAVFSRESQG